MRGILYRSRPAAFLGAAACLLAACLAPPPSASPATAPGRITPAPATSAPPSPTPPATDTPPRPPPSASIPPYFHTSTPTLKPVRVLFTGDINPGRCPAQAALARDDFTLPYAAVAGELRAADLTVGSLDGSLSEVSPPAACPEGMNLIGPARTVEGLAFAGFDLISVATNHAKDCGVRGWGCADRSFLDTLANLRQAGIRPVGGGRTLEEALAPVLVDVAGTRLAFVAATEPGADTWAAAGAPGTAPLSEQALPALLEAVTAAKAEADVVIVLAQWGVEYAGQPSASQRRWARQLVQAGATLVVGNHPHVVQAVETFTNGALVAYALGNFVFDQRRGPTSEGVVLEATFAGPVLVDWQLLPVRIYDLYQPRWAEPADAAAILGRVEAASTALPQR